MSSERETHIGDPLNEKYVLDSRNRPKVCRDIIEWGKWFEEASESGRRTVARTTLKNKITGAEFDISTVFLGLDHRFGGQGKPILFESMAFGGPDDGEQRRCCTWKEAEKQHLDLVDYYTERDWEIQIAKPA